MDATQVSQILDELGKRLGPTGQHVWEVLIRQQVVMSSVWGILCILGLIAIVVAYIIVWRVTRPKKSNSRYSSDDPFFYRTFGAFLAAGFGVLLMIMLAQQILVFLNPEYYALTTILHALP